jgi:hypothetical protein
LLKNLVRLGGISENEITGAYVNRSRQGNLSLVILVLNKAAKNKVRGVVKNKEKLKLFGTDTKPTKNRPLRIYVIERKFELILPGRITENIKKNAKNSNINGGIKCKSNLTNEYGTLGAIITCRDDSSNEIHYGITCRHVVKGDKDTSLQLVNGTDIGKILQSFWTDNGEKLNDIDFAIASLTAEIDSQPGVGINGIGNETGIIEDRLSGVGNGAVDAKELFFKQGATSKITRATDFKKYTLVKVEFDGQTHVFENVYQIRSFGSQDNDPFVKPGDSGSVVLIERNGKKYPCGILFAMADNGLYGIAFNLCTAIDRLDAQLSNNIKKYYTKLPNKSKKRSLTGTRK